MAILLSYRTRLSTQIISKLNLITRLNRIALTTTRTKILARSEWSTNSVELTGIEKYKDGSKMCSLAGIFSADLGHAEQVPLDELVYVFQAEIFAITNLTETLLERDITGSTFNILIVSWLSS